MNILTYLFTAPMRFARRSAHWVFSTFGEIELTITAVATQEAAVAVKAVLAELGDQLKDVVRERNKIMYGDVITVPGEPAIRLGERDLLCITIWRLGSRRHLHMVYVEGVISEEQLKQAAEQ
jgi:hypothetical protein